MNKKIIFLITIFVFICLCIYYFYPEKKLPANSRIDTLVVYKSKRQMLAYSDGIFIKDYTISLGGNPVGKKQFKDDQKTPEGIYSINSKSTISNYHKYLSVSYPGTEDKLNANMHNKEPGGLIEIHGLPNKFGFIAKFQRWYDWTAGCIAVTNEEIDELYASVKVGTRIEIYP